MSFTEFDPANPRSRNSRLSLRSPLVKWKGTCDRCSQNGHTDCKFFDKDWRCTRCFFEGLACTYRDVNALGEIKLKGGPFLSFLPSVVPFTERHPLQATLGPRTSSRTSTAKGSR